MSNISVIGNAYSSMVAITPSDTTLINCNAIYIGGLGGGTTNIALSFSGSATPVTFIGVHTGDIIPIRLVGGRIMATNTTATDIVALQ